MDEEGDRKALLIERIRRALLHRMLDDPKAKRRVPLDIPVHVGPCGSSSTANYVALGESYDVLVGLRAPDARNPYVTAYQASWIDEAGLTAIAQVVAPSPVVDRAELVTRTIAEYNRLRGVDGVFEDSAIAFALTLLLHVDSTPGAEAFATRFTSSLDAVIESRKTST